MEDLRIFALGGLDENGKNMYCIEFENKLFIVNCGIKRPDGSQYGVDYIIPDFSYVKANKSKLKGIIITHYHDDMMFALPHLIKEVEADIYAPHFCCTMIRKQMKDYGITDYSLHELPRQGETVIGGVNVNTFGLTHSTPDAIGVAIETPKGQIVVAEQFVIDFDMHEENYNCDIGVITEIGKKGVFAALIESSYSSVEGFTAPRHRISPLVRDVFFDAQGRIIVTVYQQNLFRIKEIIELTKQSKRKLYVYDDELRFIISNGNNESQYKLPEGLLLSDNQFKNDMENVVVVISDNGANVFKKMHKIAINEDEHIELRESDTVIIASPVVSGTEKEASSMENELYRDNVHICKLNKKQVLSMHPAIEDIKMFLYMLKPTYFIPVMGDYRDFITSANLAVTAGMRPDKIIILDNGQIAAFENGKLKSCGNMIETIGENMIGVQDNKDISSFVLKDREALASDGVIVIGISIDFNTKEVIGGPDIQSRGVIYVKDSEYLIKNVAKIVVETIEEKVADGTYNNMQARTDIREKVSRYVLRETGKKPMILPAIIEINL